VACALPVELRRRDADNSPMQPATEMETESGVPLEIESLTASQRGSAIVVVGASSALFALLAFSQPGPGHESGYVLSVVLLWWMLYYISLPKVMVAFGPDGIEFVDMSWAIFFRYPRYRVAFRDVVEVGSRLVQRRSSRYIKTQVKVKISEVPLETRNFSVTNQHPAYDEFLKQLKDRIDPSGVQVLGLGIEAAEIRAA
jgi:hypothetical protein